MWPIVEAVIDGAAVLSAQECPPAPPALPAEQRVLAHRRGDAPSVSGCQVVYEPIGVEMVLDMAAFHGVQWAYPERMRNGNI